MRIRLALPLAVLALLALAGPAQAAITVANTNDSGAGSLRQAVLGAPAGETINLPAGTYTLSSPLDIEKSLTIAGNDDADTTIRAGGSFRVIEFIGPLTATVSGVTVREGSSSNQGAGIWAVKSDLTLRGATVAANKIDADGGAGEAGGSAEGAGLWVAEGSLALDESNVTGNIASAAGGSGKEGGSVEGGGIWAADASVTITHSTIRSNEARAHGGEGAPDPAQRGGSVEGGGIWVAEAPLSLVESEVVSNEAQAIGGPGSHGGIVEGGGVWSIGPLNVTGSTLIWNSADTRGGQGLETPEQDGGSGEGGALWAVQENSDSASIVGSAFLYNRVDGSAGFGGSAGYAEGGAIWEVGEETSKMAVGRSTIAQNSVRAVGPGTNGAAQGGGVWAVGADSSSVSLVGVTLAENAIDGSPDSPSGPSGENLFWSDAVSVGDTIIANGSETSARFNCSAPLKSSRGFNLETGSGCGLTGPGDKANANPLLQPPGKNSGPTDTMALPANSPAVDQGAALGLATDQRDILRPIDLPAIPNSSAPGADGADIGAYELQPTNQFSLDALKRNKKKGTATISVGLNKPAGGTLVLTGNGLKRQTVKVNGQSTSLSLKVIPTGKGKKALNRKKGKGKANKRKVQFSVTYAPPGNAPRAIPRKATLVKKKPHKRHKKRHHRVAAL